MKKRISLILCTLCYSLITFSQSKEQELDSIKQENKLDEVVVSGTRFKISKEKSGKTIYKITTQDLERNAGKTVVDILNEVPGVQMEGNFGSPGTNINTYIRGGRNKNTLILIDGTPLNDPSGINASYDLRLLPISQIESIEVLKGGLSTLYGTGASSAVINITLKENKGDTLGGRVDFNYGSYNTATTSANINGKANKFSYMLSGNYSDSEGFSSATDEMSLTEFENDGFLQKNGFLKLGYQFNNKIDIKAVVANDNFETDYDGGAFFDANNRQNGNLFRVGVTPTFKYNKGQVVVNTVYGINERKFVSDFPSEYVGRNLQVDISNKHKISNTLTGFWGVNAQHFSYNQKDIIDFNASKFSSTATYASLFYEPAKGLNIHLGSRLNYHSEYETAFVYNINPSYLIGVSNAVKLKLFSSLSTTYITPTGFQLFSSFGNTELQPESSLNVELGSSLYSNKAFTLNVAYFYREEDNVINFVSQFNDAGDYIGGAYENLEVLRYVRGGEADVLYTINKNISFSANYTYIYKESDTSTFYRIPANKFGTAATISPLKDTTVSLKYNFTGARTIFDFISFSEIDLDSYGLLDVFVQQKLLKNKVTIYGALNNILDTDFVSVYGFSTRGRNFNVGVNYNF